jgi:hypothetical protein
VPTFRASGSTGFNVQNMPRDSKYGVNLRNCIRAPEGRTFVIADLSQIEPRCLAHVCGDKEFLDMVSKGVSPYEAHARATMDWKGGVLSDEDDELYLLAKIRVLQLGYGCGWHRFYETVQQNGQLDILSRPVETMDSKRFLSFAEAYMPARYDEWDGLDDVTRLHWTNAFIQVQDFRDKNPKIISLWKEYDAGYKGANAGEDFEVELLNGRVMRYFRIRPEDGGNSCVVQRLSKRRTWYYGSKILENRIQAEARNCFMEQQVAIRDAGFDITLQIHDEVVVEVDGDGADQAASEIVDILSTPPDWLSGCPLSADFSISDRYMK